jgi:hypothetical protein
MRAVLLILVAIGIAACSKKTEQITIKGENGHDGVNGSSCSVEQLENGAKMSCTDGSFAYIYNGRDGSNGTNGVDGSSCSISGTSSGASVTCSNGTSAAILNGLNGTNGQSCSIQDLANGAKITCGSQSAIIYDGEDADTSVIGIAGYIKPCGAEFNNDEIFLRMTDGNILALYDGGPHEDRLVLLAPGNYITTDRNKNRTCNFTVTNDLQITNERVQ